MDAPLPPVTPQPVAAAPASDVIQEDIHCRKCGYNLRGLSVQGNCPECGTVTSLTVAGDRLRCSDPDWLDRIARGCRYIVLGTLLAVTLGCLGGGAGMALGIPVNPAMGAAFGFMLGLVSVYGAWLLTAPEPARVGLDRLVTARKVVRYCLIIGLLQGLVQIAAQPLSFNSAVAIALLILGGIAGLVGIAGEFAKFLYLQKLSERIPDKTLAGRAKFLRWAYAAVWTCMVLGGVVAALGVARFTPVTFAPVPAGTTTLPASNPTVSIPASTFTTSGGTSVTSLPTISYTVGGAGAVVRSGRAIGPPGMALGAGCFMGILGLGVLVISVMSIFLTYRFGKRVRAEAQEARLLWEAAMSKTSPAPLV